MSARRRRPVGCLVAAASLAVASCGGSAAEETSSESTSTPGTTEVETDDSGGDDDERVEESTTTDAPLEGSDDGDPDPEESGPYPLTLEQQIGEVTIESSPEVVVALDAWSLDFLDELDVTPSAAYTFGPVVSWLADEIDVETTPLATGALPFEEIAALDPDLISDISGFFTVFAPEPVATLTEIAPTLSPPADGFGDPWQDRFLHLAAALDLTQQAETIIAESEAKIATISSEYPALDGAAVTFARLNPDQTVDIVVDESDFTRQFLNQELGFTTPTAQQEAFDAGDGELIGGALQVSLERADLIGDGADAAVVFAADPTVLDSAVWQSLAIVADDRVVLVDLDGVFAVRTPSPKAIDYVFDNLLPQLDAAASGAGASSAAPESAAESAAEGGAAPVLAAGAAAGSTLLSNFTSFSPTFNDAVNGPGPVTALLPSDAALGAAQSTEVGGALQSDFELLDEVLQYHVIDGALSAEEIVAAGEVMTLLGETITVAVDGDTIELNDGQATVSAADLVAGNGIAHVIEGVLIPPSRAGDFGG